MFKVLCKSSIYSGGRVLEPCSKFCFSFIFYEYILNQVKSVPLEEIRRSSLLAEKFLCDKLDWAKGIEAAQVCQVIIFKCIIWMQNYSF